MRWLNRLRSELWSWGARVCSLVTQIALVNVLTRLLGVDGYGYYAFLFTLIGYGILADLGTSLYQQNRAVQQKAFRIP